MIVELSQLAALGEAVGGVATTRGGNICWSHARNALGEDIAEVVDHELTNRPAGFPGWTDTFPHLQPD